MYRFIKRGGDLILALVALAVLAPLLVPVMLLLLLTGEHHVFYLQQRIGRFNKPFAIWKFATMLKASPALSGGLHTKRHDPRVLPLGRILRMTKINELPQLINIIKGDMAIVGPRPLVDKTFAPYPAEVRQRIYNIRPGLTGIGSIIFRDEEGLLSNSDLPTAEFYARHIAPAKGALELWYQDHLSWRVDALLIFLTAWVIISPRSRLPQKIFRDLPRIEVPGLPWQ